MNAVSHGLSISRAAAVWGLRLYLRHFVVIFSLALVPTLQRFAVVNWGDQLPSAVNIGSEIVTFAARIAVMAYVATIAIVRDPDLKGHDWDTRATWATRFAGANKVAGLVVLAVLGLGLVVFKFLPEFAIASWVAAENRDMATAIMLAVKNPVVITFTFLWVIGVIRHMMLAGRTSAMADT